MCVWTHLWKLASLAQEICKTVTSEAEMWKTVLRNRYCPGCQDSLKQKLNQSHSISQSKNDLGSCREQRPLHHGGGNGTGQKTCGILGRHFGAQTHPNLYIYI